MTKNKNQDLVLPSGWMVWGEDKEQQFSKLIFSIATHELEIFAPSGVLVQKINLDTINCIKISKIIRAPAFYLVIDGVTYTVGLFGKPDSLRKMTSPLRPLLIILFGELAYPSVDAAKAGSMQVFNDHMEKLHNWLRDNSIKSYRSRLSRNTLFAIWFIGLAILFIPAVVIVLTIAQSIF